MSTSKKEGLFQKLIDTLLHDPSAYNAYLKLKGRDIRFTDYEEIVWLLDEAKAEFPMPKESKWYQKWFGDPK